MLQSSAREGRTTFSEAQQQRAGLEHQMTEFGRIGLGGVAIGGFRGLRGKWNLKGLLGKALDLGVSFVDLAPSYASEASEDIMGQSGFSDYFKVISKAGVPYNGMSCPDGRVFDSKIHGSLPNSTWVEWFRPEFLEHYCTQSLRRIRKEQLDAYLLHAVPFGFKIEPWIEALASLKARGFARTVGFSSDVRVNFSSGWADVVELPLSEALQYKPTSNQTVVVNGILRETLGNLTETKRLVATLPSDYSILVGTGKTKNLEQIVAIIS